MLNLTNMLRAPDLKGDAKMDYILDMGFIGDQDVIVTYRGSSEEQGYMIEIRSVKWRNEEIIGDLSADTLNEIRIDCFEAEADAFNDYQRRTA